MPKFKVNTPSGETFMVDAPEGATEQDAIGYVVQNYDSLRSQKAPAPAQEEKPGIIDYLNPLAGAEGVARSAGKIIGGLGGGAAGFYKGVARGAMPGNDWGQTIIDDTLKGAEVGAHYGGGGDSKPFFKASKDVENLVDKGLEKVQETGGQLGRAAGQGYAKIGIHSQAMQYALGETERKMAELTSNGFKAKDKNEEKQVRDRIFEHFKNQFYTDPTIAEATEQFQKDIDWRSEWAGQQTANLAPLDLLVTKRFAPRPGTLPALEKSNQQLARQFEPQVQRDRIQAEIQEALRQREAGLNQQVKGVNEMLRDLSAHEDPTAMLRDLDPTTGQLNPELGYNQRQIPGMDNGQRIPGVLNPEITMAGNATSGGLLDPALRARLEAELNPQLEQRVTGQGELFTGVDPLFTKEELALKRLQTDSLGPDSPAKLLEDAVRAARERPATPLIGDEGFYGNQFKDPVPTGAVVDAADLQTAERFRSQVPRGPDETIPFSPDPRAAGVEPVTGGRTSIPGDAGRLIDLEDRIMYERANLPPTKPQRTPFGDTSGKLTLSKARESVRNKTGTLDFGDTKPNYKFNEKTKTWEETLPKGGRKQAGVIHPDLLTYGVAGLIEKIRDERGQFSPRELMEKFRGVFRSDKIDEAIKSAENPKSNMAIVLLTPDEFHNLAMYRDLPGEKSREHRIDQIAKWRSIEKGLKTEKGLDDIPYLVAVQGIDGKWYITSHEGRHRFDVFKKKELDLVPVRVYLDLMQGGKVRGPSIFDWPKKVFNESAPTGRTLRNFPEPLFGYSDSPTGSLAGRSELGRNTSLDFTNTQLGASSNPLGPVGHVAEVISNLLPKREIDKRGLAATIARASKELDIERRNLSQIVKEENITKENTKGKDIPFVGGYEFHIDSFIKKLTEKYPQAGKIMKWAVDQRREIDRNKVNRINENESKAFSAWEKVRDRSQLREMLSTWLDNVNSTRRLDRADFKTQTQWEVYNSIHQVLDSRIDAANAERLKNGLPMINKRPNYFPSFWSGDYGVTVKNKAGQTIYMAAANTKKEALLLAREFQKKFPDLEVGEPFVRAGEASAKNKYAIPDLIAFEQALQILDKNDPATAALQRAHLDLLRHRGFAKHALEKMGVKGFLGSEAGYRGLKNAEKALTLYMGMLENHIANLQKSRLQEQLVKLDPEIAKNLPNTMQLLGDYFNHTKGAFLNEIPIWDAAMRGIGKLVGRGPTMVSRALDSMSSFASVAMLVRANFFAIQPLQTYLVTPKIQQMRLRYGKEFIDNPYKLHFEGWGAALSKELRDAGSQRLLDWARKEGYLSSVLFALLELNKSDIRSGKFRDIMKEFYQNPSLASGMETLGTLTGEAGEAIRGTVRTSMDHWERLVVRAPTILAFEKALRKIMPDEQARFRAAAEMTDEYMTHYDRESIPLAYSHLGPTVGKSAAKLKQYSHNFWGQFFEYAQAAKDKGELSPLGMFLGQQVLISGLKGGMLMAEAAAISALVFYLTGIDMGTPEEWALSAGKAIGDWLEENGANENLSTFASSTVSHGLPSAIPELFFGISTDFSGSLAAPGVNNLLSVPIGPQYFGKAAAASLEFVAKLAMGKMTEQTKFETAMAISPALLRPLVENVFTPGSGYSIWLPEGENGVTPKVGQKMKGNYVRETDPLSQSVTLLFGKTLDESKADIVARATRGILARDLTSKIGALDVITDNIINGEDPSEDAVQRYIENGGDPRTLIQAVQDRIIERQLTYEDRTYRSRSMTPQKAHKIQTMEKLIQQGREEAFEENRGGDTGSMVHRMSFDVSKVPSMVDKAASKHGINPDVLMSMAKVENRTHNPVAKSSAGAVGLMQMKPSTFKAFGGKNIKDPEDNINTAARYLAYLKKQFGGDTEKALAAYNIGETKLRAYLRENNGKLPPEAQRYLEKIKKELTSRDLHKPLSYEDHKGEVALVDYVKEVYKTTPKKERAMEQRPIRNFYKEEADAEMPPREWDTGMPILDPTNKDYQRYRRTRKVMT